MAKLKTSSKPADLTLATAIDEALANMDSSKLYQNREVFLKALKAALKTANADIKAPLLKAMWQGLAEKNHAADICYDAKGNPEPDADLRDYENVPLKEDIQTYF